MIFVDTGAWLERDLAGREHRDLADRGWQEIDGGAFRVVTTDLVLSELATFMKRAGAPGPASERAAGILASKRVEVEPIAPEDRHLALRFFKKFRDQGGVTWCDCISFAIMRRLRIRRAFAFDGDFDRAGFELWPERGRGQRT